MNHLYPSLHEKYQNEGVCPVCLLEMAYMPRFICSNRHIVCNRCKPYYHACPQCLLPLQEMAAVAQPATVPYPPAMGQPAAVAPPASCPYPTYPASAPPIQAFQDPAEHMQSLVSCPYSHLGCSVKCAPSIRETHVSRCQYRHHSPNSDGEPRVACRYQTVGCNVRTTPSRLQEHELLCIYKDRLAEGLEDRLRGSCNIAARPAPPVNLQICPQGPAGDPNELVECRHRSQGCMMRVPRWNRAAHEDKCNYNTVAGHHPHHQQQLPVDVAIELRDCRYAARGCRIKSPLHSLARHEATCQYADNRQQVVYPHQAHNAVVVQQPRHEEWVDCRYAPQGCRVKSKYFARNAHESVCTYRHQR
ncbi:uncharacterized protein LOC106656347 [Trichogramma pretiosum]|uniref:uncharacterized protein LOC106656347 n=1 Tax=Trichogramma pretiosum TaxID=7493 RepID=UPI0006C9701F|nr:uncharacterized protein LOC106656347 [Trichogramma pretiosum]